MSRPRPPHLHLGISRHGRRYWFVQIKRGTPKKRVRRPDGTEPAFDDPAFEAAYEAALAAARTKVIAKPAAPAAPKGTVKWAWNLYIASADWAILAKGTRDQREQIMAHVIKSAGGEPVEEIDAAAINAGIAKRSDRPSTARNFKQTMSQWFQWLKRNGIVQDNPVDDVELPKFKKSTGWKEWTLDDIEAYEKRWPRGTRERVMLDVYIYTGLRRGDACDVGPANVRRQTVIEPDPETGKMIQVEKEVIAWGTEKSKRRTIVYLPILPALRETLDSGPTGATFITQEDGSKYAKKSLGNAFKRACVAAGVLDKSAHGLRKAAASRSAENGATTQELMAIFGWTNIETAEIYTRAANRKKMSVRAMGTLRNG